jgi:putative protease
MQALAAIFSRQGFSDGYYTRRIGRAMLGVRTEADKASSGRHAPFEGLSRRIPLQMLATIKRNAPMTLTLSDQTRSVTVAGEVPMEAQNAPLTRDAVLRNLTKLGATSYTASEVLLELDEGLMLPLSRLNDLRRRAIDAWEASDAPVRPEPLAYAPANPIGKRTSLRSARFQSEKQITSRARDYFDRIYLPLMTADLTSCDGVVLPPVIFDRDVERVASRLKSAAEQGIRYALVGNLGHLALVGEAGLTPVGDFRFNVTNREAVARLEGLGLEDEILLSPELTLPQMRDVGGNTAAIVYGRIPLMVTEKCLGRELSDCARCEAGKVVLTDRRGVVFPVLREWEHRSLVLNSIPTSMSDKQAELTKHRITAWHFLFTTESASAVDRVIAAYQSGTPVDGQVRRI